jgi:5-hydroxyisourate hydrolase-like protein (transthyretin family)
MTTSTENVKVSALKFNGYKIELSENLKGKPVARLYKFLTVGKNKGQFKLIKGYYFNDEQRRENWVKEQVANIKNRIEANIQSNTAKKEAAEKHTFKIGDCLYQSWGYDQTNIDFFEVVAVLPKSVKIRPISQIMVEGSEGFMCENVRPDNGNFTGEVFTRPVKAYIAGNTGEAYYYVSNGRHSLSLYTSGENGVYQSHYA